jgi:hypothetical protein
MEFFCFWNRINLIICFNLILSCPSSNKTFVYIIGHGLPWNWDTLKLYISWFFLGIGNSWIYGRYPSSRVNPVASIGLKQRLDIDLKTKYYPLEDKIIV